MTMLEALYVERAAYVARGLTDRVAQVDEQISLRGGAPVIEKATVEPTPDAPKPARGRKV